MYKGLRINCFSRILLIILSMAVIAGSLPINPAHAADNSNSAAYSSNVTPAAEASSALTIYDFNSKHTSAAVQIDGKPDETDWEISHELTQGKTDTTNNTAKFGTLWDENNLYIAFDVTDANVINSGADYPWDDDSVEVYIDGDLAKTYNNHTVQYIFRWNDSAVHKYGNDSATTEGIVHAEAKTDGGYTMEIAIPWSSIGGMSVPSGKTIGITAHVNDKDVNDAAAASTDTLGYTPGYGGDWGDASNWAEMTLGKLDPIVLFDDNCTNLSDGGWITDAALPGAYITDNARTTGTFENIKPVDDGQYLFYGDKAGSDADVYVTASRAASIGQGAWELQFDARIKDLITAKAYPVYFGLSFEIFANNFEYKITFNDQNKILGMTDIDSGSYIQKEVTMPSDDNFHKWSIIFNGSDKVFILLDGKVIATFKNIGLPREHAEGVKILNAPDQWIRGFTEVYVDNIKMIKNPELPDVYSNVLIDDDCSSLADAGWSVEQPLTGAYITDSGNSIGNENNIAMKPVPAGQYLIYGDMTAGNDNYINMSKSAYIGEGSWNLEFTARMVDLMTPTANHLWRGVSFEVFAGNKRFKISFVDQNKIYAMTSSGGSEKIDVNMPADDQFHKWTIAYAGNGKIFIGLDDNKIGAFNSVGAPVVISDRVRIQNIPNEWSRGVNEVYIDSIKMVKNEIPAWAKYNPVLSGTTILPASDSDSIDLITHVTDMNSEWFQDPNFVIKGSLYRDADLIAQSSVPVSRESLTMSISPNGNTGRMKLVLQFMNGSIKLDEVTKNVEVFDSVNAVNPGDTVTAEPGKAYLFTQVDKMKDINGRDYLASGWRLLNYNYDGSDIGGTILENMDAAGQLELPVKLNGWFRVNVGYLTGTQAFKVTDGTKEQMVIIDGEEASSGDVQPADNYGNKLICENCAYISDFEGNSICISPLNDKRARIAYIKLIGMTQEEIALYLKPDEGQNGKRVIYNNDGYSDFGEGRYPDESSLKQLAVDRYKDQDVGAVYWCLLTTFALNHNSNYAGFPFEGWEKYTDLMRDVDKTAIQEIQSFANAGKSPLAIVAARAHELGMSTYASLRMDAFYDSTDAPWLNGSIYDSYRAYRYIAKDGSYRNEMSYAYPQVREYVINVLKEAASYDYVDGVDLDFCRYPYILGYEPILTDAYKARYGIDPKQEVTVEGIQRWNQFKADVITQFLRDIREQLSGKKISIRIPCKGYFEYGFDPAKWISEGLIDVLIPANIGHEEFYDVKPFADMVKGSNVKLFGGINTSLSGHDLTKEEEDMIKRGLKVNTGHSYMNKQQFMLRAYEMYQAGYDGIYIFNNWKGRESLGLLGDKVKVEKWYGLAYPAEWVRNYVTVAAPVSEYLGSIKVNGNVLPDFNYAQGEYSVVLPCGTATVPSVTATAVDPFATVTVANAASLDETTTITVTASDGSKTKIYKITFAVLGTALLSVDKNELTRSETAILTVTGKSTAGADISLKGASIKYISDNPEVATVSDEGVVTAYNVGNANIYAEVTLGGVTLNSNLVVISVNTNITAIRKFTAQYEECGKLSHPFASQLNNKLDQADNMLNKGDIKGAIKHLQDFLTHLEINGMQKEITADAKDILKEDASALIDYLEQQ